MPALKVLLIVDNLLGGGAQEIVYQLCKRLDRDAFEVSVLALHKKGVYFEKINGIGRDVKVLVRSLNIFSFPSAIIRLFRLINKQRFDVIHTFLPGGLLVVAPIAWLRGIPFVHSILSVRSQPPKWYYPLMALYQNFLYAYIAFDEDSLSEAGVRSSKIKIADYPIEIEAQYKIQQGTVHSINGRDLLDSYPIVVSPGRLHPDKGHGYAINAWPSVLKEFPCAKLLIVGSGAQKEELMKNAEDLGLMDLFVIFVDYKEDLTDIFSCVHIFLRTSINEGINMLTLMAMASGLPVIGFETNTPKDFLYHNTTGWLVPLRDEKALAKAIVDLARDKTLASRLGQQARQAMQHYYNNDRVLSYYKEVYKAACDGVSFETLHDLRDYTWPLFNPFSKAGDKIT